MSGTAGGWWRGKTTPAKVETYTRWSFHFFAVIEEILSQQFKLELADLWIPSKDLLVGRLFLEKRQQILHGQLPIGKLRPASAIDDGDRLGVGVHPYRPSIYGLIVPN